MKTRFGEIYLELELGGFKYMGRLCLEGLFDILVLQIYSLVDHLGLEGYREDFC